MSNRDTQLLLQILLFNARVVLFLEYFCVAALTEGNCLNPKCARLDLVLDC